MHQLLKPDETKKGVFALSFCVYGLSAGFKPEEESGMIIQLNRT